jgi:hypothetical protein
MVKIFLDLNRNRIYGLDKCLSVEIYSHLVDLYDDFDMMVHDLPFNYSNVKGIPKLKRSWKYKQSRPKVMLLLSRLHEGRTYSDNKIQK